MSIHCSSGLYYTISGNSKADAYITILPKSCLLIPCLSCCHDIIADLRQQVHFRTCKESVVQPFSSTTSSFGSEVQVCSSLSRRKTLVTPLDLCISILSLGYIQVSSFSTVPTSSRTNGFPLNCKMYAQFPLPPAWQRNLPPLPEYNHH